MPLESLKKASTSSFGMDPMLGGGKLPKILDSWTTFTLHLLQR